MNFGELAAVSGLPRRVVIKMPIRISAVKPYKVEMEIAPVANESLQLSDIGFGIENIRPQPSADSNRTDTATTVSIAGGSLLSNPATVKVFKGVPLFDATLANIPSVILTGLPTVAAGKLGDDSNSILIDLMFVIVEQYFTPNSFNFSLTLKISPIN